MSERGVTTLEGWVEGADGIWTPSTHAQGRYDRDRWLATGNSSAPRELTADARRRLHTGKTLSLRRTIIPPIRAQMVDRASGRVIADGPPPRQLPRKWFGLEQLPIRVRCNRCLVINKLEANLLD